MPKKTEEPQFKLRLPDDMLAALKEQAKISGRSVSQEIVAMLERTVRLSEVKTQIRIPASLHAMLVDAAECSGRSLNAEMVHRMTESLPRELAPGVVAQRLPPSQPSPAAERYLRELEKAGGLKARPKKAKPSNVVNIRRKP